MVGNAVSLRACRWAAIALLWLIAASASTQSYYIRVLNNTNLRVSHSLESDRARTVPSGTSLHVVGSFGKWLKINHNGRDLWMANWVQHSRDDAPPKAAIDIDNCCFVDRQCQSDSEWTAGYWAYQKDQCAAPNNESNAISTPPSSADADQANNCCFIGWLCQSDDDWQTGYRAYHSNQCEHPGLAIEGPDSFVDLIRRALDVMQERSPEWYAYVISGLEKALLDPAAPRSAVESWSGTWRVPPDRVARYSELIAVVGSLSHEACHVHRHRSGQVSGGLIGERACVEAQLAATLAVYPSGHDYYHNWLRNLIANIENPDYQWWH